MYRINYFIIKQISRIPFWMFDIISYLLFFLTRYVFKYRYKVIIDNITKSFPHWSQKDIKRIANKYYFHLIDLSIETIKTLSIKESKFKEHFIYTNPELIQSYFSKGKNAIIVSGHFGNWEWVNGIEKISDYHSLAVYLPLKNKFWNKIMKAIRERFSAETIPMDKTFRAIVKQNQKNQKFILGLVSDQCPPQNRVIWSRFLNRDTAYFEGPDKISRKLDAPVFYLSFKKIKRHYYKATFQLLSDNVNDLKKHEIIHKFSQSLENDVKKYPELYMWSHKRWKYEKKE